MIEPPKDLKWKEVRSVKGLPKEEGRWYWCRMRDGNVKRIIFGRHGNRNWITWNLFWHPDVSPLDLVAAWAPCDTTAKSPQTPEERREYHKRRRLERRARWQSEREKWVADGKPRAKLLKRSKPVAKIEPAKKRFGR